MRHYETMYLLVPELDDEQVDAHIERFSKVVADNGGEVTSAVRWEQGRRKMAYEIKDKREAMYVLMQFVSESQAPDELDRLFKISDDVLRHIIVRQDEKEE